MNTIGYEARCGRCGETFNPCGLDDLEHVETEAGVPCGGPGELVGSWGGRPDPLTPDV